MPKEESREKLPRLNKAIAASGNCSRRMADELIRSGQVSINGDICLDLARRVLPSDSIAISGDPLAAQTDSIYLMLNKPIHTLCTASDPEGRRTVLELLPEKYRRFRLFTVGRLDYFSEGLLILTNDGELANKLMHPRYHLPKRYEVLIRGAVTEKTLQNFRSGMTLKDGPKLAPVRTSARRLASGDTLLYLELRQGVNRQIRRMCEQEGLTILKLKRTGQGPLQLGKLAPGAIRPLSDTEIAQLREFV